MSQKPIDPKHWNLLMSREVDSLSQSFFSYSIAYLTSAEHLCSLLARSYRRATFERGAVVLFLARHAVELFFKGAIVRKSPGEKYDHDLDRLQNRYYKLYPGKVYVLKIPFGANFTGMSEEEMIAAKARVPPLDQRFRYPSDRFGKVWPETWGFEANSFLVELKALKTSLDKVVMAIEKNDHDPRSE